MIMKYISSVNKENCKKAAPWVVAVTAVVVLLICVLCLAQRVRVRPGLLSALPGPEDGAPLIAVEAEEGNFPLLPLRLFAESSVVASDVSPLSEALLLFGEATRSALIVTERPDGIVFYGVMQLERKDKKALASGKLPKRWSELLTLPELVLRNAGSGEIRAANLAEPIYFETRDDRIYLAGESRDVEAIRKVSAGKAAGMKRRWGLGGRAKGRVLLSDGGVLASMAQGADAKKSEPLVFEAAWSSRSGEGEARWRVTGLDKKLNRNLTRGIKAHDWSKERTIVPSPLLLAFGINMPNPGRNMANLPVWAKSLAENLTKLGLKDAEATRILTGPAVFSLGGRTRILWFELPGMLLDVSGRGKAAYKLIDLFWSRAFMGVEPGPVGGFTRGGASDLPFSVMAAANEKKMIIGLTDSFESRSRETEKLLDKEKKAIGWFFADFPMLGKSLAEMPSVSALLSLEDEERPVDQAAAERLRGTLDRMGKLFIVWDTHNSGHAKWYK